jgi:16S rRNA U516 pseudouridylate synthase RsuA-like enzyme
MTRTTAGNSKINIYFNDGVLKALKVMARAKGTTYSELIREASRQFVLKNAAEMVGAAESIKKVAK